MNIGGFEKLSFCDYPKKLSSVLFTQGCPFRCRFCYNSGLMPVKKEKTMDFEDVFSYLQKQKKHLDAVVFSGGEPTIHKDLFPCMQRVKNLGYLVKLDSSGVKPSALKEAIQSSCCDYIAMDIKAPLPLYSHLVQRKNIASNIEKSAQLLLQSNKEYEFRITWIDALFTEKDLFDILQLIQGAKKLILQRFYPDNAFDPEYQKFFPTSLERLAYLQKICSSYVTSCSIR